MKNNILTALATALLSALFVCAALYLTNPNIFQAQLIKKGDDTQLTQMHEQSLQNTKELQTVNSRLTSIMDLINLLRRSGQNHNNSDRENILGLIEQAIKAKKTPCTDISAEMDALSKLKTKIADLENNIRLSEADLEIAEDQRKDLQSDILHKSGGKWASEYPGGSCPGGTGSVAFGDVGGWQSDETACLQGSAMISAFLSSYNANRTALGALNREISGLEGDISDLEEQLDTAEMELKELVTKISLLIGGGANICPPYQGLEIADL